MNESHFNEIERVLLHCRGRPPARDAPHASSTATAPRHLVAALEQAKGELEATACALTQGTYFAVTDQESLAV